MVIYRPGKVEYTDLGVTLENIVGVTGQVRRFLFTGSQFVLFEYDTSDDSSELNFFDTDGSEAVSRLMEKTGILDLVFDDEEDRFYALRWNDDVGFEGSSGVSWDAPVLFLDDFSLGSPLDPTKPRPDLWSTGELPWGAYSQNTDTDGATSDTDSWALLKVDANTGRLTYKSSSGRGLIKTGLAYNGDFQAWATFHMSLFPNNDSVCSIRLVDESVDSFFGRKNNVVCYSSFRGDFDAGDLPTKAGAWQSGHAYLDGDNTNGKWVIRNLRIREEEDGDASYNLSDGSYSTYTIKFNSYTATDDENSFIVEDSGAGILSDGTITNASKTFHLVDGPVAFSLVGDPDNDLGDLNGTSIQLKIRLDNTPAVGDSDLTNVSGTSGFFMGVGRAGTNLYTRRDADGSVSTLPWQSLQTYNLTGPTAPDLAVELYTNAMAASASPDLTIDDFRLEYIGSGDTICPRIPTLTVEAYDSTGNVNPVTGVTDSEGYAIKYFDAIRLSSDSNGSLASIRDNGCVSITSDQQTAANDGSLCILVKRYEQDPPVLYKFKKDVLPITTLEIDANAELSASGTLDYSNRYKIGSFSYNGYSGGEISYTTDNWADVTRGLFLNTVLTGTLSGTNPRAQSWIQNSDYTCWNINDFDSLYGLTITGTLAGQVKLYNMTSDTAAFVNIVSSNKLLPAGTNNTSEINAQVMNVYGLPLSGKTVSFTITSGDGAVSPPSSVTNSSGIATTTYTVGTAVTTSTLTATVNI